jgi:hypothetical protein
MLYDFIISRKLDARDSRDIRRLSLRGKRVRISIFEILVYFTTLGSTCIVSQRQWDEWPRAASGHGAVARRYGAARGGKDVSGSWTLRDRMGRRTWPLMLWVLVSPSGLAASTQAFLVSCQSKNARVVRPFLHLPWMLSNSSWSWWTEHGDSGRGWREDAHRRAATAKAGRA